MDSILQWRLTQKYVLDGNEMALLLLDVEKENNNASLIPEKNFFKFKFP